MTRATSTSTSRPFWNRVRKTRGCWLWKGRAMKNGYGVFGQNGSNVLAHRLSYELKNGKIPHGLEIDHLCRVRNCVNPKHLEAVTSKENSLRGDGPPARNARKTHCAKGHPFSGENLRVRLHWRGTWQRECMTCVRSWGRDYHRRKRLNESTSSSPTKIGGRS